MAIRSMTGYGQGSAELGDARVSVELRAVNHRYADVRLRLPQELYGSEREIRRRILERVKRGRVELNVNVEPLEGGASRPRLNPALVDEAMAATKLLRSDYGLSGEADVGTVLSISGLFRTGPLEIAWGDDERAALDRSLGAALEELDRERQREGRHLQQELSSRIRKMTALAAEIRELAARVPGLVRERLVERLRGLAPEVQLDPARVAQEAVLFADRADVTEELVRLDGHLEQAGRLLESPDGEPLGKRLDFLLQEINRETNTINSKSAELELSRRALALKAELEKVREQVQNLE